MFANFCRCFLLISITSVIFLSGCSRKPPLRVGLNIWPGYEFIYLAQELGYYREEGVDVQIVEFSSLGDARRSFERGQIDGLGTTVVEVMLAAEATNDRLKIVSVVDYSDGADVILSRPEFPDMQSLKGKRVGVELGSICVYVLSRALAQSGMALSDVFPVSKDQSSMEADLRAGLLDAVVTYPPTSTQLLRTPGFTEVFSTAKIPGEVVDVIAFGAGVSAKRPKDVAAVIRAFQRAQQYYKEHPAEALRIMSHRESISTEEFADALTNGMQIVRGDSQEKYFRGGEIEKIIARTGQVLSELKLLTTVRPAKEYYSDAFVFDAK